MKSLTRIEGKGYNAFKDKLKRLSSLQKRYLTFKALAFTAISFITGILFADKSEIFFYFSKNHFCFFNNLYSISGFYHFYEF